MSQETLVLTVRFLDGTEEVIDLHHTITTTRADQELNLSTNGVLVVVSAARLAGRRLADDFLTISKKPDDGLNTYTVHLLYPDYMAEVFGHDDFLTTVRALTPEDAFKKAVAEVESSHPDELNDEHDMHVLGIYAGVVDDLNPYRNE